MTIRSLFFCSMLVLAAADVCSADDQELLQKIRALYAAAAYEDVLAVITALPSEARVPNIDQYRAFCLIALGQQQQAQDVIETLVTANPSYAPDPLDMSPRILEVFNATRQRVLPALTKRLYAEAKAALDRKDREAAVDRFEQLLRVIDGAGGRPDFADLRVLAAGFLDLSRALPAVTVAPPNAAAPAASRNRSAALPVTSTPPKAVKQELPVWAPYDGASRRSEFSGAIRVRVGPDGRVQSAEMVRRIHPAYDGLLLEKARSWIYQPARMNDVPIQADVVVEVILRPEN